MEVPAAAVGHTTQVTWTPGANRGRHARGARAKRQNERSGSWLVLALGVEASGSAGVQFSDPEAFLFLSRVGLGVGCDGVEGKGTQGAGVRIEEVAVH